MTASTTDSTVAALLAFGRGILAALPHCGHCSGFAVKGKHSAQMETAATKL